MCVCVCVYARTHEGTHARSHAHTHSHASTHIHTHPHTHPHVTPTHTHPRDHARAITHAHISSVRRCRRSCDLTYLAVPVQSTSRPQSTLSSLTSSAQQQPVSSAVAETRGDDGARDAAGTPRQAAGASRQMMVPKFEGEARVASAGLGGAYGNSRTRADPASEQPEMALGRDLIPAVGMRVQLTAQGRSSVDERGIPDRACHAAGILPRLATHIPLQRDHCTCPFEASSIRRIKSLLSTDAFPTLVERRTSACKV